MTNSKFCQSNCLGDGNAIAVPSQKSPFAQSGPALLAAGFLPLPIHPFDKMPAECGGIAIKEHVHKRSGRVTKAGEYHVWGLAGWNVIPESEFDWRVAVWERMPVALGVGVRHSSSFIGFDYDIENQPELQQELLALFDDLPGTTVRRKGRKGFCQYLRCEGGIASHKINLEDEGGIDILAAGKQSVLPPSIHPDTCQRYVWLPDSDALENVELCDLPLLSSELLEKVHAILEKYGVVSVGSSGAGGEGGDFDGEYHHYFDRKAMHRLGDWIPALDLYGIEETNQGYRCVPTWRKSGTGRAVEQRKQSLYISTQNGVRDTSTGELHTPTGMVAKALGVDDSEAMSWLFDRLGFEKLEPWKFTGKAKQVFTDLGGVVDGGVATNSAGSQSIMAKTNRDLPEAKPVSPKSDRLETEKFEAEQATYLSLSEGRGRIDLAVEKFFSDKVPDAVAYVEKVTTAQNHLDNIALKLQMLSDSYYEAQSEFDSWWEKARGIDQANKTALADAGGKQFHPDSNPDISAEGWKALHIEDKRYSAAILKERESRLCDLADREESLELLSDEYATALDEEISAIQDAPPIYMLEGPAGVGKSFAVKKHVAANPNIRTLVSQPRNDLNEEFRDTLNDKADCKIQLVRSATADDYTPENLLKEKQDRIKMCLLPAQARAVEASGGSIANMCQQNIPVLDNEGFPIVELDGKPKTKKNRCALFEVCQYQKMLRAIPGAHCIATNHARTAAGQIDNTGEKATCFGAAIFDESIIPAFIKGSEANAEAGVGKSIKLTDLEPPSLTVFAKRDRALMAAIAALDDDGKKEGQFTELNRKKHKRIRQREVAVCVIERLRFVVEHQFSLRDRRIDSEVAAEADYLVSIGKIGDAGIQEEIRKHKSKDAPIHWGKHTPLEDEIDLYDIMYTGPADRIPPVVKCPKPASVGGGFFADVMRNGRMMGIKVQDFRDAISYFYAASGVLNCYTTPNMESGFAEESSKEIGALAALFRNVAKILTEIKEIVFSSEEKPGRIIAKADVDDKKYGIALEHRSMIRLNPVYRGAAILLINAFPEPSQDLEEIFRFKVWSKIKRHPEWFKQSVRWGDKYEDREIHIRRKVEILDSVKVRIDERVKTVLLTGAPASGRGLGLSFLKGEADRFQKARKDGKWHDMVDPIAVGGSAKNRGTEANNRDKFKRIIEGEVNLEREGSDNPKKVVVAANKTMMASIESGRGDTPDKDLDYMSFGRLNGTNKFKDHDSLFVIGFDNPGDAGFAGYLAAVHGVFVGDHRKYETDTDTIKTRYGIKQSLGRVYYYVNDHMREAEVWKIRSTVGQGVARIRPLQERTYDRLIVVAVRGKPHFLPTIVRDWAEFWEEQRIFGYDKRAIELISTGGVSTDFELTKSIHPGEFETAYSLENHLRSDSYRLIGRVGKKGRQSCALLYSYYNRPSTIAVPIYRIKYRHHNSVGDWSTYIVSADSEKNAHNMLIKNLAVIGSKPEIKGENVREIFEGHEAVPSGKTAIAEKYGLGISEATRTARELKAGNVPDTHRAIVVRKMFRGKLQARGTTVYLQRNIGADKWAVDNLDFNPDCDEITISELPE